MFKFIMI